MEEEENKIKMERQAKILQDTEALRQQIELRMIEQQQVK